MEMDLSLQKLSCVPYVNDYSFYYWIFYKF